MAAASWSEPTSSPAGYDKGYFARKHVRGVLAIVVAFAIATACGMHTGFDPVETLFNLPGSFVWLAENFIPSASSFEKLPAILASLWVTFLGATAAAVLSCVLAYIVALVGCNKVGFGGVVQVLVRGLGTVLRNIPSVAWAFILIFSYGQSEFVGFLVLFMKSFGFLLRAFLENIEEVPQDAVDALRAAGATRLHIVMHVIVPLTMTQVVTWLLYMTETNVRDATLVGMLTGTGIGFRFELYYRTFRYDTAGLVIVCIALMAICCEVVSNFVRRRVMQPGKAPQGMRTTRGGRVKLRVFNGPRALCGTTLLVLALVAVWALITMNYGSVNMADATRAAFNNFGAVIFHPSTDGYWTMQELLGDLMITISLAVLTTLCGSAIAFVVALGAACNLTNKTVSNALKVLLSIVRAIPTIVWVLVFVIAISLGAEACIVGMSFHTVAFLAKAYSEAFEEIDPGPLEALRATGASWWQVVAHCVLPEKINELVSWTFIRFENNFVNTVVIAAMCGSGGIGYQLYLAANFYFSLHAVGLITYMCLAVSIVLEVLATFLRKRNYVNR